MTPEGNDGMPLWPKLALVVSLVASIVVVDLATKAIVEQSLSGEPTIRLLGDTLRVGYVLNTGVFLSLGHALPPRVRFWLFVVGVGGILAMLLGLTFNDE